MACQISLGRDGLAFTRIVGNDYNDSMTLRMPTEDEIAALKRRGNEALDDWYSLRVGPDFHPERYSHVVFSGECILNTTERCRVEHSRLERVSLRDCHIRSSTLRDCSIGAGCVVSDSAIEAGGGSFGFDAQLLPGNEVGPVLHPALEFSWADAADLRLPTAPLPFQPAEHYVNVLEPECHIERAGPIRNVYAQAGTVLRGPVQIEESSLFRGDRPCVVGFGSRVLRSVIGGTHIEGGVTVKDSWVFPGSRLEDGLLVRHSILGPQTEAACAEITACVLGGGIGLHHRSLLIAALWPEGLGNVASGAQVGSNHTGRAANAQARVSEGWFFGLNTTVQYPLDLSRAPFGLLGAGQRLPAGVHPFPFSLYGSRSGEPRVRPGWVLKRNLLMLFRNEMKWRHRLAARTEYRVFRPQILSRIQEALGILRALPSAPLYDPRAFPAIGPCPLTGEDRDAGIDAYEELTTLLPRGTLERGSRAARTFWERLGQEAAADARPQDFHPVLEYYHNQYIGA